MCVCVCVYQYSSENSTTDKNSLLIDDQSEAHDSALTYVC